MITALISRLVILAFGTLYPAYASYKAVRTKDVKEYVKWMMYWIVFALFTCAETFTDVLFSFWFPFYYELKVAIVFWLLSPATKGSSFLYRNFVHPAFQKREAEIDDYLSSAKEKGYSTVMNIGSRGVSYATNVIVQTAIKGGGGIFEQLRKSYSLSDLSPKLPEARGGKQIQPQADTDTTDLTSEPRSVPRGRRGISSPGVDMYFSEVDVNLRQYHAGEPLGEIRSTEDISSGYSSTDQLFGEGVLMRTSSVSSGRGRGRGGRVPQTRRPPLTEGSVTLEEGEQVSMESIPYESDLMSKTFPSPTESYPGNSQPQVVSNYPEFKNVDSVQLSVRSFTPSSLVFEKNRDKTGISEKEFKTLQQENVISFNYDSSHDINMENSEWLSNFQKEQKSIFEIGGPDLEGKGPVKSIESNNSIKESLINWFTSPSNSSLTNQLTKSETEGKQEPALESKSDIILTNTCNDLKSSLETTNENNNKEFKDCDLSQVQSNLSSAITELRVAVEKENENISTFSSKSEPFKMGNEFSNLGQSDEKSNDSTNLALDVNLDESIYSSCSLNKKENSEKGLDVIVSDDDDEEGFFLASAGTDDLIEVSDESNKLLFSSSPVSDSGSFLSVASSKSELSLCDPERKGKYKKRPAPPPPSDIQKVIETKHSNSGHILSESDLNKDIGVGSNTVTDNNKSNCELQFQVNEQEIKVETKQVVNEIGGIKLETDV